MFSAVRGPLHPHFSFRKLQSVLWRKRFSQSGGRYFSFSFLGLPPTQTRFAYFFYRFGGMLAAGVCFCDAEPHFIGKCLNPITPRSHIVRAKPDHF